MSLENEFIFSLKLAYWYKLNFAEIRRKNFLNFLFYAHLFLKSFFFVKVPFINNFVTFFCLFKTNVKKNVVTTVYNYFNVAVVMDDFDLENLKYEASFFKVNEKNYKDVVCKNVISYFLFSYSFYEKTFIKIVDFYNVCGIETVLFFSESLLDEDSYSFIEHFDHIFVSDEKIYCFLKKNFKDKKIYKYSGYFHSKFYVSLGLNSLFEVFDKIKSINQIISLTNFLSDKKLVRFKRKILAENSYKEMFSFILRNTIEYKKSTHSKGLLSYKKKSGCKPVSIVVSTVRENQINNVFDNYERQVYQDKELIIILNKNSLNFNLWEAKSKDYKNVRIFQLDEKLCLGECLNFGFGLAKYDCLAKMDDDDYYSKNYLSDIMLAFEYTDADIVGKGHFFVFLEGSNLLLFGPKWSVNNGFFRHVAGATIIFKRAVFERIKFQAKRSGTDSCFLKRCIKSGYRLYSTDYYNFLVYRSSDVLNHTFLRTDKQFLDGYEIVKPDGDINNIFEV